MNHPDAAERRAFPARHQHLPVATDGQRWRIISISWEGETPAFPLPADAAAALRGS
jgi:hypothetical protein